MFNDKIATAWSTYSSYSAVQSAAKLVGTNTSYKMHITDIITYSNTIGAITFLENTTTTKLVITPNVTGTSLHFHLNTPIVIATNSALHITTAPTVSSVFLSGYWT